MPDMDVKSGLQRFKEVVVSLGGKWGSDDVYFSQTKDYYYADYKPAYPDSSPDDVTIYEETLVIDNMLELEKYDKEVVE